MKPSAIVVAAAVAAVTACADPVQQSAVESRMGRPAEPAGLRSWVAARFPDAARRGTGDRAVWFMVDASGSAVAWGRGRPAIGTPTTSLVGVQFGRNGMVSGNMRGSVGPQAGELPPPRPASGSAPAGTMRRMTGMPAGQVLEPPETWSGDPAAVPAEARRGAMIFRYPASESADVVTVVVVR